MFPSMSRYSSIVKSPSSDGTIPAKWLSHRESRSKDVNKAKADGIVPLREALSTDNLRRLDNLGNLFTGIVPPSGASEAQSSIILSGKNEMMSPVMLV